MHLQLCVLVPRHCSCNGTEIDGHWEREASLSEIHEFAVSCPVMPDVSALPIMSMVAPWCAMHTEKPWKKSPLPALTHSLLDPLH